MPFKSEKQRKYLFSKKPKIAREWSEKYNTGGKMAKPGLYANINKRKKSGTSRTKSKSTISPEAYANMKAGFPKMYGGSMKKPTKKMYGGKMHMNRKKGK